jgi:hypothetical protein
MKHCKKDLGNSGRCSCEQQSMTMTSRISDLQRWQWGPRIVEAARRPMTVPSGWARSTLTSARLITCFERND